MFMDPDIQSSFEAECAVLGCILLEPSSLSRLAEPIHENDFHFAPNRLLFGVMSEMVQAGEPVDVITVYERAACKPQGIHFGGLAYVNQLVQSVPNADSLARYARVVAARSSARVLARIELRAHLGLPAHCVI